MCGLYWEYPSFCVITAVYIPVLSGMYNFIYYQYSTSEMMCGLYWEYPWFCVITAVYIPVLSGMYNFIFYLYSPSDDVWTVHGNTPGSVSSLLSTYQYSQVCTTSSTISTVPQR